MPWEIPSKPLIAQAKGFPVKTRNSERQGGLIAIAEISVLINLCF
jgi:hypothetical protein